jgi:hypothetical protein
METEAYYQLSFHQIKRKGVEDIEGGEMVF